MKITPKILSVPPYLSTGWKNIVSLHVKEEGSSETLVILLQNQVRVEIPGLSREAIHEIFEAHARFGEEGSPAQHGVPSPFHFTVPMKSDGTFDPLQTPMQHNPNQADFPPIPEEVLKKITMIARAFGVQDASLFAQPEPECNCVYCQVSRAFHANEHSSLESIEEIDSDDLKFRDWDVKQTGEKLYLVSNPLEATEQYSVFLGSPLGCTCGHKNCEHIRAVLNT